MQPRFCFSEYYLPFDAEVLFAFLVFGDTFFTLGLMVHTIGGAALPFPPGPGREIPRKIINICSKNCEFDEILFCEIYAEKVIKHFDEHLLNC